MTPPWPGKTLPLSFRPAKRLSRLSVRSPTIENATTARHSGRKNASGTETRSCRTPRPRPRAARRRARPPRSCPGRPRREPQSPEPAARRRTRPMSATHTRSSTNSSHCAPCGRSRRSRTSASQAGTSANAPASAADQGAARRGRKDDPAERDQPPRSATTQHQIPAGRARPCSARRAQQRRNHQRHRRPVPVAPRRAGTPTTPRRRRARRP